MTTLHQSLIDLPVEHAIAKELFRDDVILDRLACERSLHEFIRHFWSSMDPSEFVDGWHIGAVCEHLEAVTRGEIKRLIINIPPRHMKSLAVSVAWPAWTWALRNEDRRYAHAGPGTKFLSVSYSHRLATGHSHIARNVITSPKYRRYWGDHVVLAKDQNAKWRYDTTAKGYRLATSVEGMATGEGGDIITIDDPINALEGDLPQCARLLLIGGRKSCKRDSIARSLGLT